MKYVVLLGDGMSDEPLEELGGLTPLEKAHTPNMDRLAREGQVGLAHTVPEGFHPGSDVANLSVFGYDPASCYSGRSPLEAASMGVELGPDDVAFRLNFVTITPMRGALYMEDFSAGHITTEESRQLIAAIQETYGGDEFDFYPGVSYRHLMVWHGGKDQLTATPPHDISQQIINEGLPQGEGADTLMQLMNDTQLLLKIHPVNVQRETDGKPPANSIWLWGHGRAPQMQTLQQMYGLTGSVISAVDLIKGIGVYAGLNPIEVEGATGYIDTNYLGKAEAALEALKTGDYVYLHVEAPDEAAHSGKLEDKLQAIEDFDAKVVGTVLEGLKEFDNYRVLVTPDHPTPIARMTHTSDPVPFIIYGSNGEFTGNAEAYSEKQAAASGVKVDPGWKLMEKLLSK